MVDVQRAAHQVRAAGVNIGEAKRRSGAEFGQPTAPPIWQSSVASWLVTIAPGAIAVEIDLPVAGNSDVTAVERKALCRFDGIEGNGRGAGCVAAGGEVQIAGIGRGVDKEGPAPPPLESVFQLLPTPQTPLGFVPAWRVPFPSQ